ncbi:corticotropin releasing hormone b [Pseudochaenichthys georgianus]|uniref:corticotropin releasing hormone b n=1 Tax=Pseudochaenichthys georgianus TaxID=52239 RepID=UPI00146BDA2D|nr:corticotropin releasing hormone b [Pseudochaenichthys georgianus]
MKLNSFGTTVILLVAFFPRCGCRAVESPGGAQRQQQQRQRGAVVERLGEEYFLRLGSTGDSSRSTGDSSRSFPAMLLPSGLSRALQLTRRLLQGKVGNFRAILGDDEESMERGRRSEDPPISLDLTFHLLREMMEMSKAEQMAQQAQNNRRMMELFGK